MQAFIWVCSVQCKNGRVCGIRSIIISKCQFIMHILVREFVSLDEALIHPCEVVFIHKL